MMQDDGVEFLILCLLISIALLAIIALYNENPWERAKRVLIYKIQRRDDPHCRCDPLDKMIAAEMNGAIVLDV